MMDGKKRLGTGELVAALRKDCRECGSNSLCLNGEMNVYCAVRDAADRLEEYVDRCARFSEEVMVLRERQRNDPLTLNELKEMDGEPVWVVWLDGRLRSRWHIVGSSLWIEMFIEWDGAFSPDYGKTWLAYRHKPEEAGT